MSELKCICQICTCGQHRCSHNPQSNIMNQTPQPCPFSEYSQKFKPYREARPRESLKPPLKALTRDAKMEGTTTTRLNYTAHPITPPPPKPPVVYVRPDGLVDGTSEYKKRFLGKWNPPAKTIRPPQSRQQSQAPFDHKSSNSIDYVALPPLQREIHRENRVYEPPQDPFDGRTTVQSDFVDFGKVKPAQSLKPPLKAELATEPLNALTSYQLSFTPQAIPARFQKPKEVYSPSKDKFGGITTFNHDFPGHVGMAPAQSLKPPQSTERPNSPFEGKTVNSLSYRTWELPKRFSRPPTIYAPPTQKFAASSTFKTDFPDYGRVSPAQSLRPPPRPKENTGQFKGLTTQNTDYKVWPDVVRPEPIQREKKYEAPKDQFEGVSTFKDHYKGEYAPRTPSTKPPPTTSNYIVAEGTKMDSHTVYRDNFSRNGYQPCPALYLSEEYRPPSRFLFSHRDPTNGHTLYSAVNETDGVQLPQRQLAAVPA